jgi:hypothetical protein
MTAIEKKKALVDYLIGLQADIESKFDNTVCENWSLDGFIEDIDQCICDIIYEIESDEE